MAKDSATHKKKSTRAAGKRKSDGSKPSEQELHIMIKQAAYFRAEQRNFTPGFEEVDWFEAEKEVTSRLGK